MRPRLALAAACALALALPAAALAAHALRFTIGQFEPAPRVKEYLEGPCGAAVDSHGDLYVSDYYHDKIDVFSSSGSFITQITGVNPLDAPCGLAVDSAGRIYADAYHEGVVELSPSAYPPSRGTTYSAPTTVLEGVDATGVALDPTSGNLLVDERTSVAEYEAPVAPGATPLRRIGTGALADGYGLAVSGYTGTEGVVYVADAADSTVKAFLPAVSLTEPVATFAGAGTALGRFNDLTDAALAVNDSDGHLFVADDVDGALFEHPRAAIEEFEPGGTYVGEVLPPGASGPVIVDGGPSGLAIDDGGGPTQGDLYVTDGNSEESHLLAFGPTLAGTALAPATGASSGRARASSAGPTAGGTSGSGSGPSAAAEVPGGGGPASTPDAALAGRHRRAVGEEVTRQSYKEAAEPICRRNTKANERILAGVRREVRQGRLKPAAARFARAARALRKALHQLERVPRPSADEARLARWFALVKTEAGLFARAGKKLKAGQKAEAEHLVAKLSRNADRANVQVLPFGFHYCRLEPARFT